MADTLTHSPATISYTQSANTVANRASLDDAAVRAGALAGACGGGAEFDAPEDVTPVGPAGWFDAGVVGPTGVDGATGSGPDDFVCCSAAVGEIVFADAEDGAAVGVCANGGDADDAPGNASARVVGAVEESGAAGGAAVEFVSEIGGDDAGAAPGCVAAVTGAPFDFALGSR